MFQRVLKSGLTGLSLATIADAAGVIFYLHHVEILKEGEGDTIPINHYLKVHAKGMLMDGTVFEDTRQDFEDQDPKEYFYGQNRFQCWEKALPEMRVGSIAMVTCPPTDAYGSREHKIVQPNSNVKFELEVFEVLPAPEPKIEFSVELLNNSFGPFVPYVSGSDPEFIVTITYEASDLDGKQLDEKSKSKVSEKNQLMNLCFQRALPMLRKGSRARISCPFELSSGGTNDFSRTLTPFTDLVYILRVDDFAGAGDEEVVVMRRPMVHQDFNMLIWEEGEGPLIETNMIVSLDFEIIFNGEVLKKGKTEMKSDGKGIKCLEKGILMMRNKMTAVFTCPPDMAFGDRELGKLEGNSTIHLKITVEDVKEVPKPTINFSVEKHNEGTGPEIPADTKVKFEVVAKLAEDGKVLHEAREVEFSTADSGSYPCLSRGLRGLQKGQKATINCPWDMGTGEKGAQQDGIKPYTDLIFDVEIVDFEGAEPAPGEGEAPVADHPDTDQLKQAEADEAARKAEEL